MQPAPILQQPRSSARSDRCTPLNRRRQPNYKDSTPPHELTLSNTNPDYTFSSLHQYLQQTPVSSEQPDSSAQNSVIVTQPDPNTPQKHVLIQKTTVIKRIKRKNQQDTLSHLHHSLEQNSPSQHTNLPHTPQLQDPLYSSVTPMKNNLTPQQIPSTPEETVIHAQRPANVDPIDQTVRKKIGGMDSNYMKTISNFRSDFHSQVEEFQSLLKQLDE